MYFKSVNWYETNIHDTNNLYSVSLFTVLFYCEWDNWKQRTNKSIKRSLRRSVQGSVTTIINKKTFKMPTGYTAGILDGDIKNFKQFATLCMRAFGATIHMRDDGLNEPYVPRVPGGYHYKAIHKAEQLIKDAKELSDEEVVSIKRQELLNSKKYHEEAIEKTKMNAEKLKLFLEDAKRYKPPTREHTGIKVFMMQQLSDTLDYDGSTYYHEERLKEINDELESLTASSVRESMKLVAYKDLAYHTKELSEEIERCNKSNKWVEDFLASLSNREQSVQESDTSKVQ